MTNKDVYNKEKRDRFKRLAENRTNAVLKKLKILGNCANKNAYAYGSGEINKIFGAIEKKLKETKAKFNFSDKENFSF